MRAARAPPVGCDSRLSRQRDRECPVAQSGQGCLASSESERQSSLTPKDGGDERGPALAAGPLAHLVGTVPAAPAQTLAEDLHRPERQEEVEQAALRRPLQAGHVEE